MSPFTTRSSWDGRCTCKLIKKDAVRINFVIQVEEELNELLLGAKVEREKGLNE